MNIQDAIQRLAGSKELYNAVAKVLSVNGSVCDVQLVKEDLELFDVRLQASESNGILVTPKVGSYVLVSYLDNTNAYVTMFSEVETYTFATGDDSLKEIMADLITTIKQLQVQTAMGVSSVPIPNNISALDRIDSRLNKFFNH